MQRFFSGAFDPAVGLMRAGSWMQGQVKLEAGDLLVAFTDGVSEAMNHTD